MPVVPELEHELSIWTERHALFDQIAEFDVRLAKLYKNLDASSSSSNGPEILEAVKAIRNKTHEMDQAYGILGSLFRSGSRTTFFASQAERYADLYSASPYNLLYYPSFYFFRAPMMLLPHESTVDHLSKVAVPNKDNVAAHREKSLVQASLIHEDEADNEPNSEEGELERPTSSNSEVDEKNFSLKSRTK